LRARGVGMIYVSHRLDEIFRIADRVAVLRDGQLVGAKAVEDTTPSELVNMIVGREVKDLYVRAALNRGRETLRVSGLATDGAGPVSFTAYEGEVLGLVGLRGAGHEQVARALFGVAPSTGEVSLLGKALDRASPQVTLKQGVGLIARDRTEESVAPALAIRENMFLNPFAMGRSLLNILSPSDEAQRALGIGEEVGLKPNDPTLAIEALSGGNQQKVVVGRWLATGRKLLIAEDPTAGVDVGAKSEIYRLVVQALESGLTVIVVSTDFEEVAHICHRALVFSRGRIVAEIAERALTTQSLIHAASASEVA
jgi:ribose transport system ATP-binding protein